jgi:hypothetical protein
VLSLNLYRRHMDASQKALAAARSLDLYAEQAKARQRLGGEHGGKASGASRRGETKVPANLQQPSSQRGEACERAAAAVGVSPRYVAYANKVLTKGDRSWSGRWRRGA